MAGTSANPLGVDGSIHAGDETTPLLAAPDTASGKALGSTPNGHGSITKQAHNDGVAGETQPAEEGAEDQGEKPLKAFQITLLCFVALQDPIAYFSIFPFINEMIERTGSIPPSDVGFWSGMIESLFSLVQMALMLVYGRIADRIGRKPVLVFSLFGVSIASGLFGMSQTLAQMIVLRCCAGLFAGSVVTIRTMISEQSTKKTQARVFSWYMFARNLGIFTGPIIGGGFANPTDQYPRVFGRNEFFRQHPYALSSFVTGAVGILMAVISLFGLEETLKKKDPSKGEAASKPMTTWEVLKTPGVAIVLWVFNHVMLVALCYTAVSTVFMYTPVPLGGFGFTPPQISLFLALAGFSQACWMLIGFPYLQRRFGTSFVLLFCTAAFPIILAIYPILNEFLRHNLYVLFWTIGPINLIGGSGVSMAFACVQLCLNDVSPSPDVNATLNGIALAIQSGIRAVAPALFTSIFAFGVKWGKIDGHLVWIFLVMLAIPVPFIVRWLPKKAQG
ncbi:MFS general substrate transporter [Polychaeton citri CBS 116435]|uniref:MFS general substrate transporter n=1 Tax=Polychaeton citri CBS 116435 TaxID=1314669 RepID=A0A9P4UTM0_9PEZI|nr:MFS general substrate transporter [Polychaeton citri CBS 116435]